MGNQKLFNMINEYLNVLQSVRLPFAMLPVLHFAAQNHLMGRFRSGTCLTIVSSLLAVSVLAVNVVLIIQFIQDPSMGLTGGWVIGISCYGVLYTGVCIRMVWSEIKAIFFFLVGCCHGMTGKMVNAAPIGQDKGLTVG